MVVEGGEGWTTIEGATVLQHRGRKKKKLAFIHNGHLFFQSSSFKHNGHPLCFPVFFDPSPPLSSLSYAICVLYFILFYFIWLLCILFYLYSIDRSMTESISASTMSSSSSPSPSSSSSLLSNDYLLILIISLLWGFTNPFLNKNSKGIEKISTPSPSSSPPSPSSFFSSFFLETQWLLTNISFLLPFLLNQLGSIFYLALLGRMELSLAMPITNSLTFIMTSVATKWVEGGEEEEEEEKRNHKNNNKHINKNNDNNKNKNNNNNNTKKNKNRWKIWLGAALIIGGSAIAVGSKK